MQQANQRDRKGTTFFPPCKKTFYQQTGLNFLTKLQLTVDQHNILTDFYNMFGIVLKP